MRKYNETNALCNRIAILQEQKEEELKNLKQQLYVTYESIRPINLIKNTFKDIVSAPDIKHNVFKSILGLATGYLSKKMLIGSSHSTIKKVAGTVLEFVVANLVSNRADTSAK